MNIRSLVKKIVPTGLFRKIEPYGHWGEAILEEIYLGFPARKLKVIGVTGTDGKTSTATFIAHMLRTNGYKVALMTTISIDYGDGKGGAAESDPANYHGVVIAVKKAENHQSKGGGMASAGNYQPCISPAPRLGYTVHGCGND